jgi:hypothetical protein
VNETIASRVKRLEGGQGAPSDEALKFRVFGVEALPDGTYTRTNLRTGNVKVLSPAQLGIEPYQPKEGPTPSVVGRGATLDTVAVPEASSPEVVPEPAQPEADVSPQEALDAYVASHGSDTSIECVIKTRELIEAVKAAGMRAAARHVGEFGVW